VKEWLYGRNAVYEALRARRREFFRLRLASGAEPKGRLSQILELCAARKLPIEHVPRSTLDSLSPGHQGVALETSGYPYSALLDILALADRQAEPPFILILDALQDPQNLGTLLRAGEAMGIHGVLLPFRHTATVTPAVVNASSGASEHLHIAQANLAQSIANLKEQGVWVIGLEASPDALLPEKVRLDGPLALVVGSEGSGMRPLVRSSCDLLMQLPMRGQVASLNAATAGSIALYLAWQARRFSGSTPAAEMTIDDSPKP
jgi:23S rRNA (guanosine2251-2'-O)-methyltransferase